MATTIIATRTSDGLVRKGFQVGETYFIGRFTGNAEEFTAAGWELKEENK